MNRLGENRRVVVTGFGVISPLGLSAKTTWRQALKGASGVNTTTCFDTTDCPVQISAEVKDFDVTRKVGPFRPDSKTEISQASSAKDAKRVGRFVHLALAAGLDAYEDSGLDSFRDQLDPRRLGVNIGVGIGGLTEIETVHNEFLAKGYRRITPFFIPLVIPNMASGQLSILLNLKGPNLCNVTACTSSAHSIGESFRQIQRGEADIMFAGGAEAVIGKLAIGGFAAMKALSAKNQEPQKASRPFDKDRDGFVMGEGAVVLVLEALEVAQKRNARIYAECKGYGISGDAYHMTSPSGEGGKQAMELALQDAGLLPEQIGYINTHATSTRIGDLEEARSIAALFPEARKHLHLSATKSMTGHLLGAAGSLEAFFSIMAIQENKIPPTINLDSLDSECAALGLNFTPHKAIEKRLNYTLSNSFGFGGTNATLIFGRV